MIDATIQTLIFLLYGALACFLYGVARYVSETAFDWLKEETQWSVEVRAMCSYAIGSLLLVLFALGYGYAVLVDGMPPI